MKPALSTASMACVVASVMTARLRASSSCWSSSSRAAEEKHRLRFAAMVHAEHADPAAGRRHPGSLPRARPGCRRARARRRGLAHPSLARSRRRDGLDPRWARRTRRQAAHLRPAQTGHPTCRPLDTVAVARHCAPRRPTISCQTVSISPAARTCGGVNSPRAIGLRTPNARAPGDAA